MSGLLNRKLIALIVPALIFASDLKAQDTDYKKIFGRDWDKAEAFIAENESWMKMACARYHIYYPVAAAVIFPELVRYSALRDKIEITLLKTLFINLGDEYADFSIGEFQMKPSFAQVIHEKAPLLNDRIRSQFRAETSYGNPREYRSSIVKDLETPQSEFIYLLAFIEICDAMFGFKGSDEYYRLKILATAYNCGLSKDPEQIKVMSDKKFFNTKLYKTENYSYSAVSLCWYRSYMDRQKMTVEKGE
jgi:hypothetical protein